jgi:hypothetical protein
MGWRETERVEMATDFHEAYRLACEADLAFRAELVRLFGWGADERRYDASQEGWSDEARRLRVAFVEASGRQREAWEASMAERRG